MLEFFIVIFVLVIDQLSKILAIRYLKPINSITIIEGVFNLTYTENLGAAFGIFENQRVFFIVVALIASAVIIYYLFTYTGESMILKVSLSMILAGAIGNNLIDRVRLGYVVDMLHFKLIDFPVFNVADCSIVLGTILLAVYLLFLSGKTDINMG